MAGNFRAGAGVETASQGRTAVQGSYVPVRQAPVQQVPVQQVPAGYQLAYQVGGPRYMYGETPLYGAYYRDGGTVPGQIYGNMRGSREGADMFGFWPTMFQSSPYATASQMYTPGLGVMPLIGYPSKYPHVVMGGYSDWGGGIANQAINMMLPLVMMGLYRQMFPMAPQAPAAAARTAGGGGGGKSGGSGGGASQPDVPPNAPPEGERTTFAIPPSPSALDIGLFGMRPDAVLPNGQKLFTEDFSHPRLSPGQIPFTPESAAAPKTPRSTVYADGSSASPSRVDRVLRYGASLPPPLSIPAQAALLAKDNPVSLGRTVGGSLPIVGPIIQGASEYFSR